MINAITVFSISPLDMGNDDDHNWLDMEIVRDVPNAASTYYQQQATWLKRSLESKLSKKLSNRCYYCRFPCVSICANGDVLTSNLPSKPDCDFSEVVLFALMSYYSGYL